MQKTKFFCCILVIMLLMLTVLTAQEAEAFRGHFTRERTLVEPSSGDNSSQAPSESPTTPPSAPSAPSSPPQQPSLDAEQGGYSAPTNPSSRFNHRSYTPAPAPTSPALDPAPFPSPSVPEEDGPSEPAPLPQAPSWLTSNEARAFRLLNEFRANNDLPPLQISRDLVEVARLKAQDIIDNDYFGHVSPVYGSVSSMLRNEGVSFRIAGENLSKAGTVSRAQLQLEYSSQGHRQVMLNRNYNKVGIGVLPLRKTPGIIMVQIFTD